MTRPLVIAGLAACWGFVVLVWVAGALYNGARAPRVQARGTRRPAELVVAIAGWAILIVVSDRYGRDASVDSTWVRLAGLVVLVVATVFTLWARLSLSTMWSMESTLRRGHELRMSGPYAVTRHPIYTGLLGMLLGSTLLGGIGRWVVLVPIGLLVLEAKIRAEERLLVSAFPLEYAQYRRTVPQLVPGLLALRPSRRRRRAV